MPSRISAIAGRARSALTSPTAKKIGIGLGVAAGTAALAYGGYRALKAFRGGNSRRRQTLAKIRNKRRIWQEKAKLERAKKSYEKVISQ